MIGTNANPEETMIKLHFSALFARKKGTNSWHSTIGAMRFVFTSRFISTGVKVNKGSFMRQRDWIPAAMITVSIVGNWVMSAEMLLGSEAVSLMSKQDVERSGCEAAMEERRSERRPVLITFFPWAWMACAREAPIPDVPPIMRTLELIDIFNV